MECRSIATFGDFSGDLQRERRGRKDAGRVRVVGVASGGWLVCATLSLPPPHPCMVDPGLSSLVLADLLNRYSTLQIQVAQAELPPAVDRQWRTMTRTRARAAAMTRAGRPSPTSGRNPRRPWARARSGSSRVTPAAGAAVGGAVARQVSWNGRVLPLSVFLVEPVAVTLSLLLPCGRSRGTGVCNMAWRRVSPMW